MKKQARHDDCWQPRPGSWEEAVDPYDVQRARFTLRPQRKPREEASFEAVREHVNSPAYLY